MAGHVGVVTANARLEEIYAAHAGAVYRYALRRMQRGEAEDVAAEVFLIAWRRLEDVPAEPRGWLLGVARRVAANAHRGEHRRAALRERLGVESGASEEPGGGPSRLAQALLGLSEADREALTLIAWDGLSHREAARARSETTPAVSVRQIASMALERSCCPCSRGLTRSDDTPTSSMSRCRLGRPGGLTDLAS